MKAKKILSISHTVYPLCWDKNNPKSDKNFNQFQQNIRQQLMQTQLPAYHYEKN